MTDMYPNLEPSGEQFRLIKSSEALETLKKEVKHYEGVRKKYHKTNSVFYNLGMGSGVVGMALTTTALATWLTGVGLPVAMPIGAVGIISGFVSVVSSGISKRLTAKIYKHEQTIALAKAKVNTVQDLVSKALNDNRIDDNEFAMILSELDKFEDLKQSIRRKEVGKNPDEKYLKSQVREELQKELGQRSS